MRKKLLTILTVLLMCVVALPATAFALANAASTETQSITPVEITPDYSWYEADATEYTINSVEQLVGLSNIANGKDGKTKFDFAGKTVKLTADITFADNQYWYYNDGTNPVIDYCIGSFAGTFDGAVVDSNSIATHTIKGLKFYNSAKVYPVLGLIQTITADGSVQNLALDSARADFTNFTVWGNTNKVGFIAYNMYGTAENCHVKNMAITANGYLHYSGGMFGSIRNSATVTKSTAKDIYITITGDDNGQHVGGFVGNIGSDANAGGTSISDCSVENIYFDCTRKLKRFGGFVGYSNKAAVSNCTATNVNFDVDNYLYELGGFVGRVEESSFTSCKVDVCNVECPPTATIAGDIGGFAGVVRSNVKFLNSTVEEVKMNLVNDNNDFGNGGFIGWHSGNDVLIDGCSVSGEITINGKDTQVNAGGFIGVSKNAAIVVKDCSTGVNVASNGTTGGFIGLSTGGTITGCTATGKVTSTDGIAGGLVGYIVEGTENVTITDSSPSQYVSGIINSPVANAPDKNYSIADDGTIKSEETAPIYYGIISGCDIGFSSIQEAVDVGANTVTLLTDSTEDFVLNRTEADSFTLDLGAFTYNGVITVPHEIASFAVNGTSEGSSIVITEPFKDHYVFNGWCNGTDNTQNIAPTVPNGWSLNVGEAYHPHFTESTYEHLTVEQLHPDFGEIYYGTASESKYVTFVKKDTTDTDVITEIIVEANYFDVTYEGLTLTITPKANLDTGTYEERIRIRVSDNSTHGVTAKISVKKSQAVIDVDTSDIVVVQGQEWQLPSASTNVGVIETDKTVADMNSVGVYTVTYSVEGTDNYEGDSKQIKVTVILNPSDVQDNLDKLEKELSDAITNLNTALNNKADKNALETAVNELTSAYKEADETLNKALQGQITANANEIADLKTKLTNAESTLEDAIKKVAADLEAAKNYLQDQIDTLTTSVGANATDIAALEKAISDLDTAYKAADAIMGGRLDALESADATIKESIQALKSNLTATDEALDGAIQALKAELDKAVADLEKSIADGDKGLQDKADALTAAYKAADEAINSEIVKLKAEDATIKQSIADLQAALTSARSELKGLIDKVQKNLDDAEAELREAIAQNRTDLSKEISDLKAAKAELEKLIADIKTELESKINDVKTALEKAENDLNNAIAQNRTDLTGEIEALRKAMEDADALIKGNITELENADAAIIKDIAELEASLAGAKTELEVAIAKVQSNLDTAVDDLNNAIAQNKTDLSAEIKAVEAALKNADSVIDGKIADLVDEDTAIKTSIEALGNSLAGVKADLETAIAKVQSNLDTAVDDLNNAIAQNKTDLSAEIKAVEAALKNADSVIDGKIADLIAEDTKINASISSLENSIANTKTELKGLIDTVSKNLETAKSELEAAIATGDTALDEKITALDKAYKAADTLIKGEIAELAADDEEISAGITELEASLAAVKSELEAAIAQVQKNLDNAKAELAAKDADLEAKYGELNSKITLLVVIISVVGAISVGGAVAIVIALAKKRI